MLRASPGDMTLYDGDMYDRTSAEGDMYDGTTVIHVTCMTRKLWARGTRSEQGEIFKRKSTTQTVSPSGPLDWTICKKNKAMDTKLIFSYFLKRVEVRNRMYIIISCRENNPEQKILFFHDEN